MRNKSRFRAGQRDPRRTAGTTFRVGQTVQSVYDTTHTFVIDKSLVPERIFREKGSNRWWTRNELQRLGAPENPLTSLRLNGKGKCAQNARNASPGISNGLRIVTGAPAGLPERDCPECGTRFQPARPWQKFDTEPCRRANWKRVRLTQCSLSVGQALVGDHAAGDTLTAVYQ